MGGHGSIIDQPNSLHVGGRLQTIRKELEKALKEFEYELLKTEEIEQPLSFQTTIPTIYRSAGEYLVMDTVFYWED